MVEPVQYSCIPCSRFGDDETTLPPQKSKKQKQHKSKKSKTVQESSSGLVEKQRNAFTAFFSPPTPTPLIRNNPTTSPQLPPPTTKRIAPKITPRQRTTRPPKKVWKEPPHYHLFSAKARSPLKMYGGEGQLVGTRAPPLLFLSYHTALIFINYSTLGNAAKGHYASTGFPRIETYSKIF